MEWGTYTLVHFLSLGFGVIVFLLLYFILRHRKPLTQRITLFILSFVGIGSILFNLLYFGNPLEYLPLYLCNYAVALLPFFCLFPKNKYLSNLMMLLGFGALFALIQNGSVSMNSIWHPIVFFYYWPHLFLVSFPILMLMFKQSKLDYRTIPVSLLILAGILLFTHVINRGINCYCKLTGFKALDGSVLQVNYFYTIKPSDPFLELFWKVLPVPLLYLFVALPIIVIYYIIIYSPLIIKDIKNHCFWKNPNKISEVKENTNKKYYILVKNEDDD